MTKKFTQKRIKILKILKILKQSQNCKCFRISYQNALIKRIYFLLNSMQNLKNRLKELKNYLNPNLNKKIGQKNIHQK
jgi:hypothetical protein